MMKGTLKGTMLRHLLSACLCLLAVAGTHARSLAADGDVMMIKLRGGLFQWGTIEEHTEDTLTFRRIDTGGVVIVPWSLIEANQELDLRTQFGYVDISSDEIMITAEKLILSDGREVIGLLKERTDTSLLFLTEGRVLQIPKALVRDHIAGLQVPALDVMSKEKLYLDQELLADPTSAQSQFDLAKFCERILDFSHALEHCQAARELDPSFMTQELEVILARVEIKVANQEQVDFLANVDLLKRRDQFDRAFAQLVLFDTSYPDSPLMADRLRIEDRVERARDDYMREEVAGLWFSWMGRLAAQAARERTYEGALAYLEEGFSDEIAQNVTETLRKNWAELEEDQVRQFFVERKQGRWKPASYGLGTWLLGEEAALKGSKAEEAAPEKKSSRDQERQDQADKIQRWLRNQEMSKRSSKSEEDEAQVEVAWTGLQSNGRRNWIIAYYAENSGELAVRPKPELRNCTECGGTGVKYIIFSGGARKGEGASAGSVICATCHGIGRTRRIRYR